ncbi:hypothetical protein U1Q18_033466 [Sarracenia purpurea var. burkii]
MQSRSQKSLGSKPIHAFSTTELNDITAKLKRKGKGNMILFKRSEFLLEFAPNGVTTQDQTPQTIHNTYKPNVTVRAIVRLPFAIVIDHLRFSDRPRVLHYGPANRVDPLFLILLGVGDEVHGVAIRGELEGVGLVEDVLGALYGEARAHGDDAAGDGSAGDGGVLEPEELAVFQDEPPATPGLDVLALLREPAGALGVIPELHSLVFLRLRVCTHRRSPQTLH